MTVIALTGSVQNLTAYDANFKMVSGVPADLQVGPTGLVSTQSGSFIGAFYDLPMSGVRECSIEVQTNQNLSWFGVGWCSGVEGVNNAVWALWREDGSLSLRKFTGGVDSVITGSTTTPAPVNGDKVALAFDPATDTYTVKINGSNTGCPIPTVDASFPAARPVLYELKAGSTAGIRKNFTIPSPLTIPGAPSDLTFPNTTSTSVSVTVAAVTDAATYTLERGASATGSFAVIGTQANPAFTDVASPPANTQWWWRANATNSAGTGPYSPVRLQGTLNPATGGGGQLSSTFAITSPSVFSVPENTTTIATLAVSAAAGPVTWSKEGGADAARVALAGNILSFLTPPDFEIPTDVGADNNYVVIVHATDGVNSDTQTITISVTNVSDTAAGSVSGPSTGVFGQVVTFTVLDILGAPLPGVQLKSAAGTFDAVTNSLGQATMTIGVRTGSFTVSTV